MNFCSRFNGRRLFQGYESKGIEVLVLSRKADEVVVITNNRTGEKIRITMLGIRGSRSRMGFDAPGDYRIDREEIIMDESLAETTTGG